MQVFLWLGRTPHLVPELPQKPRSIGLNWSVYRGLPASHTSTGRSHSSEHLHVIGFKGSRVCFCASSFARGPIALPVEWGARGYGPCHRTPRTRKGKHAETLNPCTPGTCNPFLSYKMRASCSSQVSPGQIVTVVIM